MNTTLRVGGPAHGGRDPVESTLELAIEAKKLGRAVEWVRDETT